MVANFDSNAPMLARAATKSDLVKANNSSDSVVYDFIAGRNSSIALRILGVALASPIVAMAFASTAL